MCTSIQFHVLRGSKVTLLAALMAAHWASLAQAQWAGQVFRLLNYKRPSFAAAAANQPVSHHLLLLYHCNPACTL
jgi:hypothetical protein